MFDLRLKQSLPLGTKTITNYIPLLLSQNGVCHMIPEAECLVPIAEKDVLILWRDWKVPGNAPTLFIALSYHAVEEAALGGIVLLNRQDSSTDSSHLGCVRAYLEKRHGVKVVVPVLIPE